MAEETRLHPFVTAPVPAAIDMRNHQYRGVRYFSTGVRPATTAVDSGPVFVLMNTPNSGEACTLNVPGNITKAVAGSAIALGQPITVSASATFIATSATFLALSAGNAQLLVGYPETACNSGSTFNLRLV